MRKLREIDADALSEFVHGSIYDDTDIDEILSYQPTIDAVAVVRCEKCKFFDTYRFTGNGYCMHEDGLQNPRPMDFCSHGERKE